MRRRLILGFLSENGQYDLEGQGQWPAFSIPAERIPGCMVGANVVILVQICDEWFWGQAESSRILGQNGQNDLEGKGQWPPFSIPAANIPGCMFGANLVILAQTRDELSGGQGKVHGRTARRGDAGNDNKHLTWKAKGVINDPVLICF